MSIPPLSWYSTPSDLLQASDREFVSFCASALAISDYVFSVKRLTEHLDVKIGMEIGGEHQNQLLIWQLMNGSQLRVPKPLRFVESMGRTRRACSITCLDNLPLLGQSKKKCPALTIRFSSRSSDCGLVAWVVYARSSRFRLSYLDVISLCLGL